MSFSYNLLFYSIYQIPINEVSIWRVLQTVGIKYHICQIKSQFSTKREINLSNKLVTSPLSDWNIIAVIYTQINWKPQNDIVNFDSSRRQSSHQYSIKCEHIRSVSRIWIKRRL